MGHIYLYKLLLSHSHENKAFLFSLPKRCSRSRLKNGGSSSGSGLRSTKNRLRNTAHYTTHFVTWPLDNSFSGNVGYIFIFILSLYLFTYLLIQKTNLHASSLILASYFFAFSSPSCTCAKILQYQFLNAVIS